MGPHSMVPYLGSGRPPALRMIPIRASVMGSPEIRERGPVERHPGVQGGPGDANGRAREREEAGGLPFPEESGHPSDDGHRIVEGNILELRQGRAGHETAQAQGLRAPGIAGMEAGRRGIELGEPSFRTLSETAELEQAKKRASARDLPVRLDPLLPAPGQEHQVAVDRAFGHVGQVDEDRGPGAPTAAALDRDVELRPGIPDALRADLHGQARPFHGLAAFELPDLEMDAFVEKDGQRALQPFPTDELLQVAERTAGVLEELEIRA